MSERTKTLVFKRARPSDGLAVSLEDALRQLDAAVASPRDRVLHLDLFARAVILRLEHGPSNNGIYVRVCEYEEGALGSINFDSRHGDEDIEGVDPPAGQSFLREEVNLFVVGNDVTACGMANKNRTYGSELSRLLSSSGVIQEGEAYGFDDVPNQTSLADLRRTGVKAISLGVSDYLASLPRSAGLGSRVMDALWTRPSDVDELLKREANTGRLLLSRGRFGKDEVEFDPWLTGVGASIVEADDEDYLIELEDGRKMTNSNLKMVRKVKVRRFYNTVHWGELKRHLSDFMSSLASEGLTG